MVLLFLLHPLVGLGLGLVFCLGQQNTQQRHLRPQVWDFVCTICQLFVLYCVVSGLLIKSELLNNGLGSYREENL